MKKTQESGRSMVEMLGVLAIIGVLSIGGIAGYSMAMNRYRANEVLDAASKYAVIVYAGAQTYAATHNSTLGTSYTAPSLAEAGLNGNLPSDVKIEVAASSGIAEDGITLDITFPSDAVCNAGASILGEGTCSDSKITGVKFKQS